MPIHMSEMYQNGIFPQNGSATRHFVTTEDTMAIHAAKSEKDGRPTEIEAADRLGAVA